MGFIAASVLAGVGGARATMFGGVDAGALWESNFVGAPPGTNPLPVFMGIYSGYLGGYTGFDKDRGAWVGSVNFEADRLRQYASLDDNAYGGSAGVFHDLGNEASVLATVGGDLLRYSNSIRDLAIYVGRIHFKEGGQTRWFGETVEYDDGQGTAAFNTYQGYIGTVAFNWKPIKSDVVTVSVAHAVDRYDVATAGLRTSDAGSLGWLQELGHKIYVRASLSREYVAVASGPHFYATLIGAGLGVSF